MPIDAQSPRLWGWDEWIDDKILPFLEAINLSDDSSRLCVISGPTESGLGDLLEALRLRLRELTVGERRGVDVVEREADETPYEWQARAIQRINHRANQLVPAAVGSAEGAALEELEETGISGPPACWIVHGGDTLPVRWWRRTLPEWMRTTPGGLLFVGTTHPSETMADAFRLGGGGMRNYLQLTLGPWDETIIDGWRRQFLPHDHRTAAELSRYARGGWPGFLWALYEERQIRATTAASLRYIERTVTAMPMEERVVLLAAATAPALALDFVEILLDRRIAPTEWNRYFKHWVDCGLVNPMRGWDGDNLPALLRDACHAAGVEAELAHDRLVLLQGLHVQMPSESARRLVLPLQFLRYFDRESLGNLLGVEGEQVWDRLSEFPATFEADEDLRTLRPTFRRLLQEYAELMQGSVDNSLRDRIHEIWTERRDLLIAERSELETRRGALGAKAKAFRREMGSHERLLERLRAASGRPANVRAKTRIHSDQSRQVGGFLTMFGGVGWLYFSVINSASLQLFPIVGGCALIFAGLSFAWHGADAKVTTAPSNPDADQGDLARRRQIVRTQAQYALAREAHDSLYTEMGQLKARLARIEQLLSRPLTGDV